MAGLTKDTPIPQRIVVHKGSKQLELGYAGDQTVRIPFELLRVESPSAEVKGHGPGQEVLQIGKRDVGIVQLDAVGNYAVQPHFSDGHNTGIFSWDYLWYLAGNQEAIWQEYLSRLEAVGASRDGNVASIDLANNATPADAGEIQSQDIVRPR